MIKRRLSRFRNWQRSGFWLLMVGLVGLVGLISISPGAAFAKEYTFAWSSNPPPITGYRLYYKKEGFAGPPFYGTEALEGVSPIDLGNRTSFTVSGLDENAVYHFALTAYNGDEESDFSPVVTVPFGEEPSDRPAVMLNIINLLLLDDVEGQ